jgi:hypothetical protein
MAKGFGVKPDKELGYILVLMPEINAYAAKFNLNIKRTKEPFIGITNMLKEAQVWSTAQQAKKALLMYYAETVIEELQKKSKVRVSIKRLKKTSEGELVTELVENLVLN